MTKYIKIRTISRLITKKVWKTYHFLKFSKSKGYNSVKKLINWNELDKLEI